MSRLILGNELYGKSESELFALFNTASAELIRSEPGTPERRNALASLENIQRVLVQRLSI